jgi:hypothetical protein
VTSHHASVTILNPARRKSFPFDSFLPFPHLLSYLLSAHSRRPRISESPLTLPRLSLHSSGEADPTYELCRWREGRVRSLVDGDVPLA